MKEFFNQAVSNIISHGDTDIFPFPIENHIFFDCKDEVVDLLVKIDGNFVNSLTQDPPANNSALSPIGYEGFRWATQLDPIWNAYILGLVLSISEKIETTRIPVSKSTVFSYRYKPNGETCDLFDRDIGWRQFMLHSMELAKEHPYVVVCDISDCYQRIGHHQLENALKQLGDNDSKTRKIITFLANFTNTNSYGLPIGGPAARLLSELALNQVDVLLRMAGIKFCRFADDYHLFSESLEDAYASLVLLSEKLIKNEGLSLQKSKTRVVRAAEFIASSPVDLLGSDEEGEELEENSKDIKAFMSFSVQFDPYSPTAEEDYEALKHDLRKFDVIGMLKDELQKSRIHFAAAKKIAAAIKFLPEAQQKDAVLSLINNVNLLYPIFPTVMNVIKAIFDSLDSDTQDVIHIELRRLIDEKSHVIRVDINLAYAVRVLGCKRSYENEELLGRLFGTRSSSLIKRDVILILAKWGQWNWISDLRRDFRTLGASERRAFIIASYTLSDAGEHWRKHIKREFSDFEKVVNEWAKTKSKIADWSIPV